jgi:hypothetical protein
MVKIMKYALVDKTQDCGMNLAVTEGKVSNIEKYIAIFDDCKHDAYISHGEVLCGRATHDLKWADDILWQMRQEFHDYLSDKTSILCWNCCYAAKWPVLLFLE